MAVAALNSPVCVSALGRRLAVYICSRVVELLRRVDTIRDRFVSLSDLQVLDLGVLSRAAITLAVSGNPAQVWP